MKYQGDKIMLRVFKVGLGSPGSPNRTMIEWFSVFSVFTCKCVPGVLRGVDMERGLYYLLTPVDPSILLKVNCLLLGAISLPSCILTTQVRRRFKQRYFPDKHLSKPYFFYLDLCYLCLCFSLALTERCPMSPQTTVLISVVRESCESSRDWWDPVI